MAVVSIVMGSDSDLPVMSKAAEILEQLDISYEMHIISAECSPCSISEHIPSAEGHQ